VSISSRSTVAVHILGLLAVNGGSPVTSETIAESVRTNPVVVRRILRTLHEARLVAMQPGVGGGARLVRDPNLITILDIYRAVERENLFSLPEHSGNPACPIGANVRAVLDDIFEAAQTAMEEVMAKTTLAQVTQSIKQRVAS